MVRLEFTDKTVKHGAAGFRINPHVFGVSFIDDLKVLPLNDSARMNVYRLTLFRASLRKQSCHDFVIRYLQVRLHIG